MKQKVILFLIVLAIMLVLPLTGHCMQYPSYPNIGGYLNGWTWWVIVKPILFFIF